MPALPMPTPARVAAHESWALACVDPKQQPPRVTTAHMERTNAHLQVTVVPQRALKVHPRDPKCLSTPDIRPGVGPLGERPVGARGRTVPRGVGPRRVTLGCVAEHVETRRRQDASGEGAGREGVD